MSDPAAGTTGWVAACAVVGLPVDARSQGPVRSRNYAQHLDLIFSADGTEQNAQELLLLRSRPGLSTGAGYPVYYDPGGQVRSQPRGSQVSCQERSEIPTNLRRSETLPGGPAPRAGGSLGAYGDLVATWPRGTFCRLLARVGHCDVPVGDKWGLSPFTLLQGRGLLAVIDDRAQRCSLIVVRQLPVALHVIDEVRAGVAFEGGDTVTSLRAGPL